MNAKTTVRSLSKILVVLSAVLVAFCWAADED